MQEWSLLYHPPATSKSRHNSIVLCYSVQTFIQSIFLKIELINSYPPCKCHLRMVWCVNPGIVDLLLSSDIIWDILGMRANILVACHSFFLVSHWFSCRFPKVGGQHNGHCVRSCLYRKSCQRFGVWDQPQSKALSRKQNIVCPHRYFVLWTLMNIIQISNVFQRIMSFCK